MSGIGRRSTTPERAARSAVRGLGYRLRLNVSRLPGSPDIVIAEHKIAIFVHGCYWHRHAGCRAAAIP